MDHYEEIKSAYAAGLRDAADAIRKAAPQFGPEGPHSSETYAYSEGFRHALRAVEAVKVEEA